MRKFLNIILVIAMIAVMMMPANAAAAVALSTDGGQPKEIKYEYGNAEYCNCGIDHTDKPFEWWTDITDANSPQ